MLRSSFLLVALTAIACDQLGTKTQGVAILSRTPDLATASGLDSDLAAALPLDQIAASGATGVGFSLGNRESLTSRSMVAISSADITLAWSGVTVGLCAQVEAGTYAATSISTAACSDARLNYQTGVQYTFDISTAGEQYSIRVTPPAEVDPTAVVFDPPLSAKTDMNGAAMARHTAGTALKVDWSRATVDTPAFVTVYRVDYVGGMGDGLTPASWRLADGNPVYDSTPLTAADYVDLVLNDSPQTSFTIPHESFAVPAAYVVVLTPVTISTEISGSLALGSGAVAGAGSAFVFYAE